MCAKICVGEHWVRASIRSNLWPFFKRVFSGKNIIFLKIFEAMLWGISYYMIHIWYYVGTQRLGIIEAHSTDFGLEEEL